MKSAPPARQFRVDDPGPFRLAKVDAADTCGIDLDKDDAKAVLAQDTKRLAELQQRLYADGRWALLVVLQGMDASGKRSEEHTSELQSLRHLVCRLLLEKKNY